MEPESKPRRLIKERENGLPPPAVRDHDPTRWWNAPYQHPLTREQFVSAALDHLMIASDNHIMRAKRKDAHRYLHAVYGVSIDIDWEDYRKEHVDE